MTSIRTSGLAISALLAFLAAGCADSRPAAKGQGGTGSDTCVFCHGDVGRVGYLADTDPNLRASPPAAPAGKPAAVVGAHQAHVNPPSTGALRGPILCNECHVVPTDLVHATNPPANPVTFGTLATNQNNSPAWNAATGGCSATYCHGGFDFGGVSGNSATPLWIGSAHRPAPAATACRPPATRRSPAPSPPPPATAATPPPSRPTAPSTSPAASTSTASPSSRAATPTRSGPTPPTTATRRAPPASRPAPAATWPSAPPRGSPGAPATLATPRPASRPGRPPAPSATAPPAAPASSPAPTRFSPRHRRSGPRARPPPPPWRSAPTRAT